LRLKDILEFVLAAWRRNKSRTRLVLGVISICLGIIVLLMSLSFGLDNLTIGRLARHGALKAVDVTSPDPDTMPLTQKSLLQLKSIKNVASIAPSIEVAGLATNGKQTADANIAAASNVFFSDEAWVTIAGRNYFTSDKAAEVVVTRALFRSLGLKTYRNLDKTPIDLVVYLPDYDQTGGYRVAVPSSMIKKIAKKVKIVGVTSENYYQQAFIPIKLVEIKQPYYSVIRLKAKNQSDVTTIRSDAADLGLTSLSYGDSMSDAGTLQRGSRITLILLGFFALLISSMVASSTITISVLERAKQIATMKKLGTSDQILRKMFFAESVMLTLVGSTIGVVGAYILGWIFNIILWIIAKAQGTNAMMIFGLPIYWVALIIVLAVAFGFIAGFLPARKAVALNATRR